jgi:hypothetical protein
MVSGNADGRNGADDAGEVGGDPVAPSNRPARTHPPRGVAVVPAAVGTALTLAVAVGTDALPVLALAAGAALVLLVAWRLRADQSVAGTLFVLGVGFGLAALPLGATDYTRWTWLVLVGVGGLYALFLLAKFAVKTVVRAVGRRYADADLVAELWDVGASVASLLYLVWQALSFAERVVRSVAVAVVGPSMVALNAYMTVATRISQSVVDLSLLLFTVALVLGFHTLATWTRAAGLVRRWGRPEGENADATDGSRP